MTVDPNANRGRGVRVTKTATKLSRFSLSPLSRRPRTGKKAWCYRTSLGGTHARTVNGRSVQVGKAKGNMDSGPSPGAHEYGLCNPPRRETLTSLACSGRMPCLVQTARVWRGTDSWRLGPRTNVRFRELPGVARQCGRHRTGSGPKGGLGPSHEPA